MNLGPMDWALSMATSRRRKNENPDEANGLRSLLVHRLRNGVKAVMRVPLSQSLGKPDLKASIYCEPCKRWTTIEGDGDLFDCDCGRVYRMEFAVFALVEETF